jgi:hypothetical protein
MQKDKLAAFRAAIVGLVLMPLIELAPVAKIRDMRLLPKEFPFSIETARITYIVFALLCWFSIPFVNRHTRKKDAEKIRSSGHDPEMVILLLNLSLLLFPAIFVLLLSFIGFPIMELNVISYSTFVVMSGWLFWKRAILCPKTNILHEPAIAINKNSKPYTVTLAVLGFLALAFFALKIILIINPPESYSVPISWNLPWVFIYGFLIVSCIVTVISRLTNSQNAFDMTSFISILLAFWVPFGTAAYLYWRFKIKQRELPER